MYKTDTSTVRLFVCLFVCTLALCEVGAWGHMILGALLLTRMSLIFEAEMYIK